MKIIYDYATKTGVILSPIIRLCDTVSLLALKKIMKIRWEPSITDI